MLNSLVDHVTQSIKCGPALLLLCHVKDCSQPLGRGLWDQGHQVGHNIYQKGVGFLTFQPLQDVSVTLGLSALNQGL